MRAGMFWALAKLDWAPAALLSALAGEVRAMHAELSNHALSNLLWALAWLDGSWRAPAGLVDLLLGQVEVSGRVRASCLLSCRPSVVPNPPTEKILYVFICV
jgi:hypothetical protein